MESGRLIMIAEKTYKYIESCSSWGYSYSKTNCVDFVLGYLAEVHGNVHEHIRIPKRKFIRMSYESFATYFSNLIDIPHEKNVRLAKIGDIMLFAKAKRNRPALGICVGRNIALLHGSGVGIDLNNSILDCNYLWRV